MGSFIWYTEKGKDQNYWLIICLRNYSINEIKPALTVCKCLLALSVLFTCCQMPCCCNVKLLCEQINEMKWSNLRQRCYACSSARIRQCRKAPRPLFVVGTLCNRYLSSLIDDKCIRQDLYKYIHVPLCHVMVPGPWPETGRLGI